MSFGLFLPRWLCVILLNVCSTKCGSMLNVAVLLSGFFFEACGSYSERSPAPCVSFSEVLLSAMGRKGDMMGLNTSPLTEQSFQILVQCSRV